MKSSTSPIFPPKSTPLSPANTNTERGRKTFSWSFEKYPGYQVVFFYRDKGSIFGEHFHKGEDPSKNPELFLLISGKVDISFTSLDGSVAKETYDAAHTPIEIAIDPWIFHTMEALTDCVFAEYRETPFDPAYPDTYLANLFNA